MITLTFNDLANIVMLLFLVGWIFTSRTSQKFAMIELNNRLLKLEEYLGSNGTSITRSASVSPQTMSEARSSAFFGVSSYVELHDTLKNRLSRNEILTMALHLGINQEWGDGVEKERIIREIIVHQENRGRVGQIYKWLGEHRPDVK